MNINDWPYNPSPINGDIKSGSISYRTDGEWVWFDDLAEYVELKNVIIPAKWYQHIQQNNFIIPDISEENLKSLEMPAL